MEKRIPFPKFQSVKNVVRAIDPYLRERVTLQKKAMLLKQEVEAKKAKLQKEIDEKTKKLKAEFDANEHEIEYLEAGIVAKFGLHPTDLVKKVIEPNGKVDKAGKPLKETKYVTTEIVRYDEQTNEYVITLPDGEGTQESQDSTEQEPECPTHEETDAAPAEETKEEFATAEAPANEAEANEEEEKKEETELPW